MHDKAAQSDPESFRMPRESVRLTRQRQTSTSTVPRETRDLVGWVRKWLLSIMHLTVSLQRGTRPLPLAPQKDAVNRIKRKKSSKRSTRPFRSRL